MGRRAHENSMILDLKKQLTNEKEERKKLPAFLRLRCYVFLLPLILIIICMYRNHKGCLFLRVIASTVQPLGQTEPPLLFLAERTQFNNKLMESPLLLHLLIKNLSNMHKVANSRGQPSSSLFPTRRLLLLRLLLLRLLLLSPDIPNLHPRRSIIPPTQSRRSPTLIPKNPTCLPHLIPPFDKDQFLQFAKIAMERVISLGRSPREFPTRKAVMVHCIW